MLHGRRTSVSLEEPFWRPAVVFRSLAIIRTARSESGIDRERGQNRNLSSAIRTFVLAFYVSQGEGHAPPPSHEMSVPTRMSRQHARALKLVGL
jgi:predicted DNA-binding ribbon-helix-helix protein